MAKVIKEKITLRKGKEEVSIDYGNLRSAVLALRAVNHELRRKIIDLLGEVDQLTVTQIYVQLRLEQSVASQHLAILRKAEIVHAVRSGKFIHYSLNKDRLVQIAKLVADLSE